MTFISGFLMGGLAGFTVGILIAIAITSYVARANRTERVRRNLRRLSGDFDDSLEKLRAAARHPSQRIP